MEKKALFFDGNAINNLKEFFIETYGILTKDITWKRGSLDGFNDILYGGFGVFEEDEPITIFWENSTRSKEKLGFAETVKYYKILRKTCHPSNVDMINIKLENARHQKGDTLFDLILEIIEEHEHIELILK